MVLWYGEKVGGAFLEIERPVDLEPVVERRVLVADSGAALARLSIDLEGLERLCDRPRIFWRVSGSVEGKIGQNEQDQSAHKRNSELLHPCQH